MRIATIILGALLMSSCAQWQRVGSMTMMSTRNIDNSKEYELLIRGVQAEAKMKQDDALQQAIDQAVAKHAGGEYMMNVQVHVKENGKAVRVVGDVWGIPRGSSAAASSVQTGSVEMKVGDVVFFKRRGDLKKGTILAIKNDMAILEWMYGNAAKTSEVRLVDCTLTQ